MRSGRYQPGLRELRTLKHGERSFQPDGGRNVRALEQVLERLQRVGAQIAQIVIQSCNVFAAGILDGGLELRLGAEPVMNGSSVNTGLPARGADGEPSSEGGCDLGLGGRQACSWSRREM